MSLETSGTSDIREIVTGTAPHPLRPRLALPRTDGQLPRREAALHRAFGTKLVVWADSAGEIKILDGYCRHMGGDLSRERSRATTSRARSTTGGGGAARASARTSPMPAVFRRSQGPGRGPPSTRTVCCSSGTTPEGNQPPAEVAIPRIEGATSDDWTDWVWYTTEVDTNCREIIDNIVDMAHFFYVHYSFPTFFKNVFEGHVATQVMNGKARDDMRPNTEGQPKMLGSRSEASYFGPSFMIDDLKYQYEGYDIESVLLNCHYPVSADKFVLMYGMIVKKSPPARRRSRSRDGAEVR